MRGQAVGGLTERARQQVGPAYQRVDVHPHLVRVLGERIGIDPARARRGRPTDAGGMHLRIEGLQSGQDPDLRVVSGDGVDRVGQGAEAGVEAAQFVSQVISAGQEPFVEAGPCGAVSERVAGQHRDPENHRESDRAEAQPGAGDFENLRALRPVRDEHDSPATLGHRSPNNCGIDRGAASLSGKKKAGER